MNRVILTPAMLPASALSEVKQWLGITINNDDAAILSLLMTALDVCENFSGTLPLEVQCEEQLDAHSGWHSLISRPVHAITAVEIISVDGVRQALQPNTWEADLNACGTGLIRVGQMPPNSRIAVRFTAGLAPDWGALPEALRHGIVRLAAHQFRERESQSAAPVPPPAIAALWRPWRQMRLA